MKIARIRLIAAAIAMAAWLGYLGYLALGQAKPIIVSRTQLLYATHFATAEVTLDAANQPVTLVSVRESFGANRLAADEKIEIANLADVRLPGDKRLGPGTYFFPLIHLGPKQFRVVSVNGIESKAKLTAYPWTPEVERQVRELIP